MIITTWPLMIGSTIYTWQGCHQVPGGILTSGSPRSHYSHPQEYPFRTPRSVHTVSFSHPWLVHAGLLGTATASATATVLGLHPEIPYKHHFSLFFYFFWCSAAALEEKNLTIHLNRNKGTQIYAHAHSPIPLHISKYPNMHVWV